MKQNEVSLSDHLSDQQRHLWVTYGSPMGHPWVTNSAALLSLPTHCASIWPLLQQQMPPPRPPSACPKLRAPKCSQQVLKGSPQEARSISHWLNPGGSQVSSPLWCYQFANPQCYESGALIDSSHLLHQTQPEAVRDLGHTLIRLLRTRALVTSAPLRRLIRPLI